MADPNNSERIVGDRRKGKRRAYNARFAYLVVGAVGLSLDILLVSEAVLE